MNATLTNAQARHIISQLRNVNPVMVAVAMREACAGRDGSAKLAEWHIDTESQTGRAFMWLTEYYAKVGGG